MSNSIYATISRQDGLLKELQVVANNIANANTTGYKTDRAVFAEYLVSTGAETPSLSMGALAGHNFDLTQGTVKFTGGQFDVAIQGDGFFALQTPAGERLTRSGAFQLSADGQLIAPDGANVLDAGNTPIQIPPEASTISIAGDGTISADGELLGQIGVFRANGELQRDTDTRFQATGGTEAIQNANVLQGALEQSNVSPVLEMARMIEVQRAYEAGQNVLEEEHQRINQTITAVRNR
ncbi:MAG: flagellar hook-basal body complex protein [Pseudomonadota bacterium]|jgi:flagellar basal-body rod protein FlgF|nr:flagellar hook-basal body complex protein [Pseudomonadota bacterium]